MNIAQIEHTEQYDKARRDLQFDFGDFVLKRIHPLSDAIEEALPHRSQTGGKFPIACPLRLHASVIAQLIISPVMRKGQFTLPI